MQKRFLSCLLALALLFSFVPAGAPARAEEAWSAVFERFVLNQEYLSSGLSFYSDAYVEPRFGLYDLDRDGTPELLAFNGGPSQAEGMDYTFVCRDGSVQYVGNVGFRGSAPYYYDSTAYPGLFCTDGNMGEYRTVYYELRGGAIVSELVMTSDEIASWSGHPTQVTADDALFALSRSPADASRSLAFYSYDEILAMGWQGFVQAAFNTPAMAALGTIMAMNEAQQYAANIFLSNFSEQHAFENSGFNVGSRSINDLVNFAYLYCKINRHAALNTAQVENSYYYTLSLEDANAVWSRHFGFTLNEAEASLYAPNTTEFYRSFYSSGAFYFPAADGESYNRFTVVRQMEDLGNGTYRLLFDIYSLDIDEYWKSNGVDSGFYAMTASAARQDSRLSWQASGVAVVRPYTNNGTATYQLVRYRVGAGSESFSGVLREGDGWALRWTCTYFSGLDGSVSDAELELFMDGTDYGDTFKFSLSDTENELSPWLSKAGVPKEAIVKLSLRGSEQNPLYIVSDQFSGYTNLKELHAEHIYGFASGAFQGCTALESVDALDDSLLFIGDYAFKDDVNLRSVKGSEDIINLESIGTEAFANTPISLLNIWERVVKVGDRAFSGCSNLRIRCFMDTYIYEYAVANNIPVVFMQSAGNIIYSGPEREEADFEKYSFRFDTDEEIEDLLSTVSSTTYSPRLAFFLAVMARSAYSRDLILGNYEILGFPVEPYTFIENQDNKWAIYYISKKTYLDENTGSEKTLVMICVRGTFTDADKAIDFALGGDTIVSSQGKHEGFSTSAQRVFHDLKHYMGDQIPTKDTTYVITGHSMGAGVANLLSMLLFDSGVPAENVFDYNFACPNVAMDSDSIQAWNNKGEHNNIINVGNFFDMVTYMPGKFCEKLSLSNLLDPFTSNTWNKYGVSYWFDNGFQPPITGVSVETSILGLDVNVNINSAHDMKTYLDYLSLLRGVERFRTSEHVATAVLGACPVDMTILDESGNPIASVVNNEADYCGYPAGEKALILTNGDRKLIYINGDVPIDVRFYATDTGTMEYAVARADMASGAAQSQKSFTNVPLEAGKELTSELNKDTRLASTKLYVLDSDGKPVGEIQTNGTEVAMQASGLFGLPAESSRWLIVALAAFLVAVLCLVILLATRGKRPSRRQSEAPPSRRKAAETLPAFSETRCCVCGRRLEEKYRVFFRTKDGREARLDNGCYRQLYTLRKSEDAGEIREAQRYIRSRCDAVDPRIAAQLRKCVEAADEYLSEL